MSINLERLNAKRFLLSRQHHPHTHHRIYILNTVQSYTNSHAHTSHPLCSENQNLIHSNLNVRVNKYRIIRSLYKIPAFYFAFTYCLSMRELCVIVFVYIDGNQTVVK